jgi:hypothetical protein
MKRIGLALALACLLVACVRTSEGVPVAGEAGTAALTPSRSTTVAPPPQSEPSTFGVLPTTRAPMPPNTVACSQTIKPNVRMTAKVGDPQAPRITVGVPDKWSMAAGTGDVGGRLSGPGGMEATVTIAATKLDPGAAFRKYTDDLMAESSVSSVSVLPGELCGYSGQKLMGAWSDTPQNAVEYSDRIVHIWTGNGPDYLVAVHAQAPTGTPGFDSAAALLTEDFEIVLP